MTARPTPLVDSERSWAGGGLVSAEFARSLERQLAEAREECERLRVDAERYRWARMQENRDDAAWILKNKMNADAAIDAAMTREVSE